MFAGQYIQGKPSTPPTLSFEDDVPAPPLEQLSAQNLPEEIWTSTEIRESVEAGKPKRRGSRPARKNGVSEAVKGQQSAIMIKRREQQNVSQLDVVPDEVAPPAFAASKVLPDNIVNELTRQEEHVIDEQICRLIAESWQELKRNEEKHKKGGNAEEKEDSQEGDSDSGGAEEGAGQQQQKESRSRLHFWQRGADKKSAKDSTKETSTKNQSKAAKRASNNTFDVPQTFKEMCALNAGMIGANLTYITIVEEGFERLVKAMVTGDHGRLELEANIIALRMFKDVQGKVQLSEFKTCMLASLRSLLPKSWSVDLEKAWITMWDLVQECLAQTIDLPARYAKATEKAVRDMSEDDKRKWGLNAFNRLFKKQPGAEDHFNTSNSRLSILAMNILNLCVEMYQDPTRTEQVVTSLGLRHIMYNISVEYFEPLVVSFVEELHDFVEDPEAVAGVEWVLTQIAAIMIHTVKEGSNPLLRAVIHNSPKMVRQALAPLPRKDRFGACLGTVTHF